MADTTTDATVNPTSAVEVTDDLLTIDINSYGKDTTYGVLGEKVIVGSDGETTSQSKLKNYIFQPSTSSSNISEINEKVTSILEKFKTGGGISSYTVDTSKNTTETLQQDILYIDVAVVPVGCIEQVEISLNINKSE